MPSDPASFEEQLGRMELLVRRALPMWPTPPGATARLINVSENMTFLVEGAGYKSVLRLHRPGYHTRKGIEQELEWSSALARDGVVFTPAAIAGIDKNLVQILRPTDFSEQRYMVMFEFAEGKQPNPSDDLSDYFEKLGIIAARTHEYSRSWTHLQPLERLIWDADSVFGHSPNWGDWRNAPNVTHHVRDILEKAEAIIIKRLQDFGKDNIRYGLIHADMRLANLLIDGEKTCLIDFDDCGLGWYLYDFAAGISFMEDSIQVPSLRRAWVKGYRSIRYLSDGEEREIDTFVMLRRMALLAWIGSHIEAPEPQAMAPHFAEGTAKLAIRYLEDFSRG